jgi:hypothetical protein
MPRYKYIAHKTTKDDGHWKYFDIHEGTVDVKDENALKQWLTAKNKGVLQFHECLDKTSPENSFDYSLALGIITSISGYILLFLALPWIALLAGGITCCLGVNFVYQKAIINEEIKRNQANLETTKKLAELEIENKKADDAMKKAESL